MKKAFTLAEVLITLAIIGVVAALVMPGLIANYQKRALVTQIQKSINVWENGWKLMMAHDGVDRIQDTEFFRTWEDVGYYGSTMPEDKFQAANAVLKKYFNIIKIEKATDYSSSDPKAFYKRYKYVTGDSLWSGAINSFSLVLLKLADGSQVYLIFSSSFPSGGTLVFDVNGEKGPNRLGRDVFWFNNMTDNGTIIPLGGVDETACTNCIPTTGFTCLGCLMHNGWVMDY